MKVNQCVPDIGSSFGLFSKAVVSLLPSILRPISMGLKVRHGGVM